MASSLLAMRRAAAAAAPLRTAATAASTASSAIATAAAARSSLASRTSIIPSSSAGLQWQRRQGFSNGARRAAVSSSMQRMMKDMQKRQAQPSVKTMQRQNIDEMPKDIGLMPETMIKPTGTRMPSLFTAPKLRLKIEYVWAKARVTDLVSRLVYKWLTKKTKPRPVLGRMRLPKLASRLHEEMYTAFAFGDSEHLSRICTEGVLGSFRSRIGARKNNERLYWRRLKVSRVRIVSDKAVRIPVPGIPKEKPCAVRQVVFRIKSRQALVRGYLKRDRNGSERLLDAAGAELPVDEQGEVTAERMEQEARNVDEYFVLQRRMWMGEEEPWYVWGLVDETSVDKISEA